MPSISRDHLRSVAILLRKHPETGAVEPMGTAFLVQMREMVLPPVNVYLVTCEHCIGKASMVRFFDGTVIDLKREEWTVSPDGYDVAVHDITDQLPQNFPVDHFIPLGNVVQRLGSYDIGDEIYMLGLHVNERDVGKNQPRARFGNIAAWGSDDFPIEQGNGKERATHLGDMRSRSGFSGSPVFAYYEIPLLDGEVTPKAALFGIHSDQFKEPMTITAGNKDYAVEIPSSMTKIVPAWSLAFIETDLGFQQKRQHRDMQHKWVTFRM